MEWLVSSWCIWLLAWLCCLALLICQPTPHEWLCTLYLLFWRYFNKWTMQEYLINLVCFPCFLQATYGLASLAVGTYWLASLVVIWEYMENTVASSGTCYKPHWFFLFGPASDGHLCRSYKENCGTMLLTTTVLTALSHCHHCWMHIHPNEFMATGGTKSSCITSGLTCGNSGLLLAAMIYMATIKKREKNADKCLKKLHPQVLALYSKQDFYSHVTCQSSNFAQFLGCDQKSNRKFRAINPRLTDFPNP